MQEDGVHVCRMQEDGVHVCRMLEDGFMYVGCMRMGSCMSNVEFSLYEKRCRLP